MTIDDRPCCSVSPSPISSGNCRHHHSCHQCPAGHLHHLVFNGWMPVCASYNTRGSKPGVPCCSLALLLLTPLMPSSPPYCSSAPRQRALLGPSTTATLHPDSPPRSDAAGPKQHHHGHREVGSQLCQPVSIPSCTVLLEYRHQESRSRHRQQENHDTDLHACLRRSSSASQPTAFVTSLIAG
jgi:hypothetical protein